MKRVLLAALVTAVVATGSTLWACNIPVFRYALERWKPDLCEVIVFHDRELSADHEKVLAQLKANSMAARRSANVEVVRSLVGQDTNRRNAELWLTVKQLPEVTLPYVVVRTSVSEKQSVNGWHGPLSRFDGDKLLDSPVRRELSQRLLSGDSVVWLILKSPDAQRNAHVKELLNVELTKLARTVEFPEGLGLPGSELYSAVPLLMKFTVLEIDPEDSAEQFLVKLFKGFQPESAANGQPLLVPVFGRGRALEVIPADRLDSALIGDLTRYLCGACSCQVKERNPGFDLLLSTPWDQELFGDEGQIPPPAKEFDPNQAPTLLKIPPGKSTGATR